jgi:hypothetical protein
MSSHRSDYRLDGSRSGHVLNLAQWPYNNAVEGRMGTSFVGCLQGVCDYDARRADSVLKCCEASEEGVIGRAFRGWSEFARWEV